MAKGGCRPVQGERRIHSIIFTKDLLCANPVPAPGSTSITPALRGLAVHWRRQLCGENKPLGVNGVD